MILENYVIDVNDKGKKRIEYNNNNNNKENEELILKNVVIAINDFSAKEYDQLDIKKDEFLIVTDWNYKEGWVYGHRKDNKDEKGIFPKVFIKICNNKNKELQKVKSKITPEYRIKFDEKIKILRNKKEMKIYDKNTKLNINRNDIFNDSFNEIMSKTPEQLKNRLVIHYNREEGIDAGGLLRDFFYQISKEIGNPNHLLLQYSNDNSYEMQINPMSFINTEHLKYFRFIGRIIGLAIFHKQYLSLTFNLPFYKKLLNKTIEFSDMEFIDPEIYKNIQWLKNNEGVENLCLNFVINEENCFGESKEIELKPNGANVDVTDSNKNEYIDLVVQYKINNTNDKEQFNALKRGFYEIIPHDINSILNEIDLKYLISGINEIDVNDWENNTDYEGYNKNDITIINFWKCVRDFDNDNQTKLLLFATGNSQVPVTGFKDLQGSGKIQHFKIKRIGNIKDLPKSHTCFNRIDLPPYTSYTQLKQKLLLAISEGMGGFSME